MESEFIRDLRDRRTAAGQQHLQHRSKRAVNSYVDFGSAKKELSLDHGPVSQMRSDGNGKQAK